MEVFLRTVCGAALGAALKPVCDALVRFLLKKREKTLTETKKERCLLFGATALCGALIAASVPPSAETVFFFLLLILCEAIAVIDAHTRLIPNDLILAVFALAALFGIPGLFGLNGWPAWQPVSALIGMGVCFLIFLLPALFSGQVGAGDIKLAAAMGFCMGLRNSLLAIVAMGLFVIAYTLLQSRMPVLKFLTGKIPMGPFLSLSMLGVLLAVKLGVLNAILPGI